MKGSQNKDSKGSDGLADSKVSFSVGFDMD